MAEEDKKPGNPTSSGFVSMVKHILRLGKSSSSGRSKSDRRQGAHETNIVPDNILHGLASHNPFPQRIVSMEELAKVATTVIFDMDTTMHLWQLTKDVLEGEPSDQALYSFFSLWEKLSLKSYLNNVVKVYLLDALNQLPQSRLPMRIRWSVLASLTRCCQDLHHLEAPAGTCLCLWLPYCPVDDSASTVIELVTNMLSSNPAVFDASVTASAARFFCSCCSSPNPSQLLTEIALKGLDALISVLPLSEELLTVFIVTLCRTVTQASLTLLSWKVMRKFLSGLQGYQAILLMCDLMEGRCESLDWITLRGAVYFSGMCIWGSQKVVSVELRPGSILGAILKASRCSQAEVLLEIVFSLQRLVKKHCKDLDMVEWSLVVEIMEVLANFKRDSVITTEFSVLMSILQEHVDEACFRSSRAAYFQLLSESPLAQQTSTQLLLFNYRASDIDPLTPGYPEDLVQIAQKFIRVEDPAVLLKLIQLVKDQCCCYRSYMKDIVDRVVLPYLPVLCNHQDPCCSSQAVSLFCFLLDRTSAVHRGRIMDVLEQVASDAQGVDQTHAAIAGLTKGLVECSFTSQEEEALRVMRFFTTFLSILYSLPYNMSIQLTCSKDLILSTVLDARVDASGLLYFGERKDLAGRNTSIYVPKTSYVLSAILQTIDLVIRKETDLVFLFGVFSRLPHFFRSQHLAGDTSTDISNIVASITSMIASKGPTTSRTQSSTAPSRSDFLCMQYQVLRSLSSWTLFMSRPVLGDYMMALTSGLNTTSARPCIQALIVCLLEIPSTISRLVPTILTRLAQLAASPLLAMCIIAFLSYLKDNPDLCSVFSEEQYLSVLGILLPYTDMTRFPLMVAIMAHYLVLEWFVRCRPPLRRSLVPVITKYVKSNISPRSDAPQKETSAQTGQGAAKLNRALLSKHMAEITLDVMASFTFAPATSSALSCPITDPLFKNGTTTTWSISNSLISITTQSEAVDRASHTKSQQRPPRPRASTVSSLRPSQGESQYPSKSCLSTSGSQTQLSCNTDPSVTLRSDTTDVLRVSCQSEVPPADLSLASSTKMVFLPTISDSTQSMFDQSSLSDLHGHSHQSFTEEIGNLSGILAADQLSDNILTHNQTDRAFSAPCQKTTGSAGSYALVKVRRSCSCSSFVVTCLESTLLDLDSILLAHNHVQSEFVAVGESANLLPAASRRRSTGSLDTLEQNYEKPPSLDPEPGQLCIEESGVTTDPPEVATVRARSKTYSHALPPAGQAQKKTSTSISGIQVGPANVLLQLFFSPVVGHPDHRPKLLPQNEAFDRALRVLDSIPCKCTQKIGVAYIAPDQDHSEESVLSNLCGTSRYHSFLLGLGSIVQLTDSSVLPFYKGGLAVDGSDGRFALHWDDPLTEVLYHVSTLMPNSTESCQNGKKRHLGNNHVAIVYNASGRRMNGFLIKGQFSVVQIEVFALDGSDCELIVHLADAIREHLLEIEPVVLKDRTVAAMARIMAVLMDVAVTALLSKWNLSLIRGFNYLFRLNQIHKINSMLAPLLSSSGPECYADFSDYA